MRKIAGRKVQRNSIVTNELLAQVNPENIDLGNDFLDYLRSVDRAGSTIDQYKNDLKYFGYICYSIATTNFCRIV